MASLPWGEPEWAALTLASSSLPENRLAWANLQHVGYELLIYGLKYVVAKAATAATVPTPLL